LLKSHRHASASFPRNARDARGERGHFARGTRHLPNNPLAQRSFYRRQTKKTKHAFHIVCFRFLLWPSISARHIALDETTMRASQGRTSTNAITAVMVSPFFIVNCPFLFWASSLFLRKIFAGVAKILRNRNFFVAQSRIARDHDTIRNQEETIEQHRVYRVVAHAAVH
jgi:Zn-dependent protease with chaperone function